MLAKEEIEQIERAATERSRQIGPLNAEMVPDVDAAWYIVTTHPSQETIASSHLIARRFGIYLPQSTHFEVRCGRKRAVTRNIFPGYVFVFTWDIERHWRRISNCPGVARIFARPVPFAIIDAVRAEENRENPVYYMEEVVKIRKRRKKRIQIIEHVETTLGLDDIVAVYSKSYWTGIAELAPEQRISKLHRALGLDS